MAVMSTGLKLTFEEYSRMVERVYGRLPIDHLAARLAQELAPESCPYVSPERVDLMESADAMDGAGSTKTLENEGFMVPRDRIELPTRGFSILCSTN